MYILSETNGQTCNKFFQYLYYLKLCVNKGMKLRVQMPDKTIEDYPNLIHNQYISFPFYSSTISKIFGIKVSLFITRWITVVFLNNYIRFLLHQLSFHKLCFLSGKPTWTGTDETYSEIRPLLQYLFMLKEPLKQQVDNYFIGKSKKCIQIQKGKSLTQFQLDKDDIVTCGIHMRGGDYRKWLGGKYFFEQILYRKAADKLISLLPKQKVRFLICSNEPIQHDIFDSIEYFSINEATASQDIYALSLCDYIIGTLSSFNAWASLLGDVPLFTILNEGDIESLTLDDFSPVVNYKKKMNGWHFPRSTTFYSNLSHPWLYKHSNKEYLLELSYES